MYLSLNFVKQGMSLAQAHISPSKYIWGSALDYCIAFLQEYDVLDNKYFGDLEMIALAAKAINCHFKVLPSYIDQYMLDNYEPVYLENTKVKGELLLSSDITSPQEGNSFELAINLDDKTAQVALAIYDYEQINFLKGEDFRVERVEKEDEYQLSKLFDKEFFNVKELEQLRYALSAYSTYFNNHSGVLVRNKVICCEFVQ